MAAPNGLSVAFDAAPLDTDPTWTRLDSGVAGLGLARVRIERGRPTERDNTAPGTMEAVFYDSAGVLDPTNATSTYNGKLNPTKKIAYALHNPVSNTWSSLFVGYIDDLDVDLTMLTRRATYAEVTVSCSDALGLISDAQVTGVSAGDPVPLEQEGDAYYNPVTVTSDRIRAAIADTADTLNPNGGDWPADQLNLFTGNVKLKSGQYSLGDSLLNVIDEAADAEFPGGVANRFVSKDGKIVFHGRLARFDSTNPSYGLNSWKIGDKAAFESDSTVAVINDLSFNRGKENLINDCTAWPRGTSQSNMAAQRVKDTTSIAKYGARTVTFPELLTNGRSDDSTTPLEETKLFPQYYVDNYADPRNRINQITILSQPPDSVYATNVWAFICGVEISDVVHLKTTHPGGGGFDEDFYVEGLHYEIVPQTDSYPLVTLTLDLSPKAYYDTNPF